MKILDRSSYAVSLVRPDAWRWRVYGEDGELALEGEALTQQAALKTAELAVAQRDNTRAFAHTDAHP